LYFFVFDFFAFFAMIVLLIVLAHSFRRRCVRLRCGYGLTAPAPLTLPIPVRPPPRQDARAQR
jgi:hypothetical protein